LPEVRVNVSGMVWAPPASIFFLCMYSCSLRCETNLGVSHAVAVPSLPECSWVIQTQVPVVLEVLKVLVFVEKVRRWMLP